MRLKDGGAPLLVEAIVLFIAIHADHLHPRRLLVVVADAFAERALPGPMHLRKTLIDDDDRRIFREPVALLKWATGETRHSDGIKITRRRHNLKHHRTLIVGAERPILIADVEITLVSAERRRRCRSGSLYPRQRAYLPQQILEERQNLIRLRVCGGRKVDTKA